MTRYLPLDKLAQVLQADATISARIPWWIFAYEPIERPNDTYLVIDIVTQLVPDSFVREMRVQFLLVWKDKWTTAKSLQDTMELITEKLVAVTWCCDKGITNLWGFQLISIYETNTYRPSFTGKGIRCLLIDYIFKYCTFSNG